MSNFKIFIWFCYLIMKVDADKDNGNKSTARFC